MKRDRRLRECLERSFGTYSGAALAVHGKIGAVFKCLGPAHIGLQLPWPEVHDVGARHGFQGVELTTGVLDPPAERSTGRSPMTWTPAAIARAPRPNRNEFIHTLPGALALGARIDTPNVGLLMDTWHLFTSGGTPADIGSLRGEQVVHAHVDDAPAGAAQDELIDTERLLPGALGVIHTRAVLTVVDEIGSDGPTLVEPFNAVVRALPPEERVAAVAASMESVWP